MPRKRADLIPALGYPGGPCQVVQRVHKNIRSPNLRDQLTDKIESDRSLTNSEVSKIYDLEQERGAGFAKRLEISPHAQYRMDLRRITVPQVRAALSEFSKLLNDWKSRKDPRWVRVTRDLVEGQSVEFIDRRDLFIAFSMKGSDVVRLVTTYYKGETNPKTPSDGCEYSYDRRLV